MQQRLQKELMKFMADPVPGMTIDKKAIDDGSISV